MSKHRSASKNRFERGSYIAACRVEPAIGNCCADASPLVQYAGFFAGGRTREVIQTSPRSSNMLLCTVGWLDQIFRSPQYADALRGFSSEVLPKSGVFGSITGTFTKLAVLRTGSRTGISGVLSSGCRRSCRTR